MPLTVEEYLSPSETRHAHLIATIRRIRDKIIPASQFRIAHGDIRQGECAEIQLEMSARCRDETYRRGK